MAARTWAVWAGGLGCLAAVTALATPAFNWSNNVDDAQQANSSTIVQMAPESIDGARVILVGGKALRHVVASNSLNAGRDSSIAGSLDMSELQPATARQRQAALGTILAQLDAFRSGDFKKADSYQADSLRANFATTGQFRILMSQVYPEFTSYQAAQFGDARTDSSRKYVVVPITLTGEDGVIVQAVYVMTYEKSGYRVLTVLGGMNPRPTFNLGDEAQLT